MYSAVNRAKSKEKLRGAAQAAADALQQVGKDKAKDALTDPYQSFISANAIKQAVKMMEVLVKNNGGNVLYAIGVDSQHIHRARPVRNDCSATNSSQRCLYLVNTSMVYLYMHPRIR